MGLYSRAHLERIIAENGHSNCHYCGIETRLRIGGADMADDHATLDHKKPKSRGGTNDPSNLVLACNKCNQAKANLLYEDFIGLRHVLTKRPPVTLPYVPEKPVHPAYKARAGTLAAALASGEVTEFGMYRGTPVSELKGEPRNRIEPIPYHETMYILTGKRVPKRSEIFEPRGKKREFTEKEKQDALAHIYKGREYLLRTG